jgi:sn-glycerol 3-phosphate transport system ATP-binding protein
VEGDRLGLGCAQATGKTLPEVRIERLAKRFGTTVAVDEVSFTVEDGSLAVLLGPSGCGKSTTLRLVAGLETASGGRILVDGRDVTGLPPPARGLAMVFQSYALFPHLDVARNITFGLEVRRVPKAERAARLREAAALLGLEGLLHRKPSELSGGQQQRVALARAIVARAGLCLMDEPLSNLDAKLRQEMRKEIRDLQRRLAMTMLYVTHDQVEAMTMADRIVLLKDGRVEQVGTPAELYAKPATLFAAAFLGTPPMSLLALEDGPEGAVVAGSGVCVLPGRPGRGRVLGLRPEAVRFGDERGHRAVIESVEFLGADSHLACRIGRERLLVRASGLVDLSPGTEIGLAWPESAVHLFDAGSGRRLEVV